MRAFSVRGMPKVPRKEGRKEGILTFGLLLCYINMFIHSWEEGALGSVGEHTEGTTGFPLGRGRLPAHL